MDFSDFIYDRLPGATQGNYPSKKKAYRAKRGQPALTNVTLKEINLWFALRFNLRDRGMI